MRTGQEPDQKDARRDLAAMVIAMLLFFVLLAVLSVLGLTADSRDGRDWRPTQDGWRQPNWPAQPN